MNSNILEEPNRLEKLNGLEKPKKLESNNPIQRNIPLPNLSLEFKKQKFTLPEVLEPKKYRPILKQIISLALEY